MTSIHHWSARVVAITESTNIDDHQIRFAVSEYSKYSPYILDIDIWKQNVFIESWSVTNLRNGTAVALAVMEACVELFRDRLGYELDAVAQVIFGLIGDVAKQIRAGHARSAMRIIPTNELVKR